MGFSDSRDIIKNGELRLCVDFRRVNAVTKVDSYLMPRINNLIDGLGKASLVTPGSNNRLLADSCSRNRQA